MTRAQLPPIRDGGTICMSVESGWDSCEITDVSLPDGTVVPQMGSVAALYSTKGQDEITAMGSEIITKKDAPTPPKDVARQQRLSQHPWQADIMRTSCQIKKNKTEFARTEDVLETVNNASWFQWDSDKLDELSNKKYNFIMPETYNFDPRSRAYDRWEKVVMCCILYTAIVVPYEIAYIHEFVSWLFVMNRIVDSVFLIDLVVNFNLALKWRVDLEPAEAKEAREKAMKMKQMMEAAARKGTVSVGFEFAEGEEEEEEEEEDASDMMITDRHVIASEYMRTGWLVVDVVSLVPLELLDSDLKIVRLVRLLRLLKLLKILRSLKIIRQWQIQYGFPFTAADLGGCCIIILFSVHWLGCMWYMLTSFMGTSDSVPDWLLALFENTTPMDQYAVSVYYAMMTLTTIGYGDVLPTNEGERWLSVILMQVLGATVYAYIIAMATQLIMHMRRYDSATQSLADTFDDMGTELGLPNELVIRGREFCIESATIMRNERWLKLLPFMARDNRREVLENSLMQFIDCHPGLRLMEPDCRSNLAQHLEPLLFSPGEIILHSGSGGMDGVYFVADGVCGNMLHTYTKYGVLGVEGVFESGRNMIAVRSRSMCFLFRLSEQHLEDVTKNFPRSLSVLRKWAIKRAFARDVKNTIKVIRNLPMYRERTSYEQGLSNQKASMEDELSTFFHTQNRVLEGQLALRRCWQESAALADQVRRQMERLNVVLQVQEQEASILGSDPKTAGHGDSVESVNTAQLKQEANRRGEIMSAALDVLKAQKLINDTNLNAIEHLEDRFTATCEFAPLTL